MNCPTCYVNATPEPAAVVVTNATNLITIASTAATWVVDKFTLAQSAGGLGLNFFLSQQAAVASEVMVFIGNVTQEPVASFTVSAAMDRVTLPTALHPDTDLIVRYLALLPAGSVEADGPATRVFSFCSTDFTALIGTNSPGDRYSFSLVVSTDMDFSTTAISRNTATDTTNWVYWTGTQFAAFPANNLSHAYLNAYSAKVSYIWTGAARNQLYYARGVIYNVTQATVQGNMNCISEAEIL